MRDGAAFGALIDALYARHGRLDGVIHGAGVIEDKLARDKTPESFARVFETKVNGALAIAKHVRDDVGFIAFFSSISATFGNRGQADYAAANDFLDRLAVTLKRRLAARVLSINWGPWGGAGMVSPELTREYAKRGIGLIDPDAGVAGFLDELLHGSAEQAQVILMRGDPRGAALTGARDCPDHASGVTERDVAIIGMACVFPKAPDLATYWRNIREGVDAITDVPPDALGPALLRSRVVRAGSRSMRAAAASSTTTRTSTPPRSASCRWRRRAPSPTSCSRCRSPSPRSTTRATPSAQFARDRTSVIIGRGNYIGAGHAAARQHHARRASRWSTRCASSCPTFPRISSQAVKRDFQARSGVYGADTAIGLVPNLAASRIANRLDLGGSAYTVDAACASALVAVDQACRELRAGDADVVIAGGIHVCHDLAFWSVFSQLGALVAQPADPAVRPPRRRPADRRGHRHAWC